MMKSNLIILQMLKIMIEDFTRRSFDEDGEQKLETLGRIETLKELKEVILCQLGKK